MYFDTNIKLLRKRHRLTQEELAISLNMKRSTLNGYENNVSQPGIKQLIDYSHYFKISVDTLIKINMSKLRESELYSLEKGMDVFIKESTVRILT